MFIFEFFVANGKPVFFTAHKHLVDESGGGLLNFAHGHFQRAKGAGDKALALLVIGIGKLAVGSLDVDLTVYVRTAVVNRPQRMAASGPEYLVVHEIKVHPASGNMPSAFFRGTR